LAEEKPDPAQKQNIAPDTGNSENPAVSSAPAQNPGENPDRQNAEKSEENPDEKKQGIVTEQLENVLHAENSTVPSRYEALRTVIRLWQPYAMIREPERGEEDLAYFTYWARQNSFSLLSVENNPQLIQKLNLPAILEFRLPGSRGACHLALIRISSGTILLASGDRQIVSKPDVFSQYWTGRAFILWKNFFSIEGTIPRDAPRESLITLKTLLRDIGFVGLENTADFDELTQDAVKMIQGKHGLQKDGVVGNQTKIVLYNEIPGMNIPHIAEKNSQPGSQTREISD